VDLGRHKTFSIAQHVLNTMGHPVLIAQWGPTMLKAINASEEQVLIDKLCAALQVEYPDQARAAWQGE
jgi:hypothetical protein